MIVGIGGTVGNTNGVTVTDGIGVGVGTVAVKEFTPERYSVPFAVLPAARK